MDFLRHWVGVLRGKGSKYVLVVRLVRSLLSIFFLSVHHSILRRKILNYLKCVLTLKTVEAFLDSSIFNKAVFCLGEQQGTRRMMNVVRGTIE